MPKVVVDTNLMLLLAVGLTNPAYIARHKRLAAYEVDDFNSVVALVNGFAGLAGCPNVWSETSNLVRYIAEPRSGEVSDTLRRLIARSDELYVPSTTASDRGEYRRLGITDSVLLELAESGTVLLTDDLPVYLAALKAGCPAINYNHVREARYNAG